MFAVTLRRISGLARPEVVAGIFVQCSSGLVCLVVARSVGAERESKLAAARMVRIFETTSGTLTS